MAYREYVRDALIDKKFLEVAESSKGQEFSKSNLNDPIEGCLAYELSELYNVSWRSTIDCVYYEIKLPYILTNDEYGTIEFKWFTTIQDNYDRRESSWGTSMEYEEFSLVVKLNLFGKQYANEWKTKIEFINLIKKEAHNLFVYIFEKLREGTQTSFIKGKIDIEDISIIEDFKITSRNKCGEFIEQIQEDNSLLKIFEFLAKTYSCKIEELIELGNEIYENKYNCSKQFQQKFNLTLQKLEEFRNKE